METKNRNSLYPFLFELNLHETVWGGNRLKPLKGLPFCVEDKIGESWEVSAVGGSESVLSNGSLRGRKLNEVVEEFKSTLLGESVYKRYGTKFPLLVKFIDAASDLSVQVHPDDEMAHRYRQPYGKTEMWYVIDSKEEGRLYCGFNRTISEDECRKKIEDGSICEDLQVYAVDRGDVFFIPAGRVHAICGGTMIAEVQQSSDVTYRIYDYGRMGLDGTPRQLHTDLAMEALDFRVSESVKSMYDRKLNWPVTITDSPFFMVKLLEINRGYHRKLFKYDSFVIYMCMNGDCTIEILGDKEEREESIEIKSVKLTAGNTCLIPACIANVRLHPNNEVGMTRLLEIYIDNKNYRN